MSLNFATREIVSQPIVGIRATTSMEEIAQAIGALFGEVMDYLNRNGLAPSGMPFTIYHEMDRDPPRYGMRDAGGFGRRGY